ncbi:MAG: enoyl-CoA hydratase-related protein [Chlorobiaceae bacterium]
MEYSKLLIEMMDGVALVTINSPRTMNALSSDVLAELLAAFSELELNSAVRAIVLTGAGEKAFVAGADITEMLSMNSLEGHRFGKAGHRVMLLLEKMATPVIAAVNGYALGGGLELALGCDFIYASENAKVGFPEVTLGIIPGFGGTQNLPRLIGRGRASELIFTGRMITAAKAKEWGIVNEIFEAGELIPKALESARAIASVAPLAVRYSKDAIVNGLNMSKEDGFRYEASLFGVLFSSQDQKEGMGAFAEKRKAEFKGK